MKFVKDKQVNTHLRYVIASLALSTVLFAVARAESPPPATKKGCGPSITAGRSEAEIAKITEETRKVAVAFSTARTEKGFLTENAIWWATGVGYIDEKTFFKAPVGPDRGPPISFENTVHGITVEGDRAAIDMSRKIVWPDFTYDQHYHNLIIVRDGKICTLKMFVDSNMAKQAAPGVKGTQTLPE
jgi:uncharacterized protein